MPKRAVLSSRIYAQLAVCTDRWAPSRLPLLATVRLAQWLLSLSATAFSIMDRQRAQVTVRDSGVCLLMG